MVYHGLPIKNGWICPWQTVSHSQMVSISGDAPIVATGWGAHAETQRSLLLEATNTRYFTSKDVDASCGLARRNLHERREISSFPVPSGETIKVVVLVASHLPIFLCMFPPDSGEFPRCFHCCPTQSSLIWHRWGRVEGAEMLLVYLVVFLQYLAMQLSYPIQHGRKQNNVHSFTLLKHRLFPLEYPIGPLLGSNPIPLLRTA